jgi:hypothetical protein
MLRAKAEKLFNRPFAPYLPKGERGLRGAKSIHFLTLKIYHNEKQKME